MSENSSVLVHLLDKEFRVGCPPDERDNLIKAARFLDDKMREIRESNVIGLERIAVMAALNLAHELLQARQSVNDQSSSSEQLGRLIRQVEGELDELQALKS